MIQPDNRRMRQLKEKFRLAHVVSMGNSTRVDLGFDRSIPLLAEAGNSGLTDASGKLCHNFLRIDLCAADPEELESLHCLNAEEVLEGLAVPHRHPTQA